ncbi:hypothetical protein FNL39_102484 [Nocardia caishijiensis]|uniref:Lipoprotein n=1 Tax=Nocardia caishijiensis TaxID=184756 RepID=A0ABQ6YS67_9NOCA|nr:hypothetical protein FNL39_102484 [Nocardia caishijiensis]
MRFCRGASITRLAVQAAVAGVITASVAGCGGQVSGSATREAPDTTGLDFGNYQTEPRVVGNAKSMTQARAWEAQRLADHVAVPFEVDPAYVRDARFDSFVPSTQIVLNRKGLGGLIVNDTFDEVAEDLVAGWLNSWATEPDAENKSRKLHLSVLMFPDAKTAESVAPILEHDDFTFNTENVKVPITKYPKTFAHWRPSVSSIGSWTVHDRYIIFMKIDDETRAPDLASLTGQVERALEVQIPLLDKFQPTPSDKLEHVPLDPTGLMGRTLPSDPGAPVRAQPDGFATGRGALSLFQSPSPKVLEDFSKYGVDLIAFGDSVVFRSTSAAGAKAMFQADTTTDDPSVKAVKTPDNLPVPVKCFADTYTDGNGQEKVVDHLCYLQVDRYSVQVRNKNLQDLHQKVTAQYILLAAR